MTDLLAPSPGETLAAFKARCEREQTPGLMRLHPWVDDRGWSLMGLMAGVLSGGQINYSVQQPGVIKAWHLHERQTDAWCLLHGCIKAAIMSRGGERRWVVALGERAAALLLIPPGLWHGAMTIGPAPAGLLYYVDREYDPASPDEQREAHDWQWNPWSVVPR